MQLFQADLVAGHQRPSTYLTRYYAGKSEAQKY